MRNLLVELFWGRFAAHSLLFILGVVVYLNTLPNDPSFSDETGVSEYEVGIGQVTERPEASGYSVLTELSYRAESAIFGVSPLAGRIINLALFGFCLVLFYQLLVSSCSDAKKGLLFFAVLLFAVHPLNTAVMGPFSERSNLLGFVLSISAVLTTLKWIRTRKALDLLWPLLLWLATYSTGSEWLFTALLIPYSYAVNGGVTAAEKTKSSLIPWLIGLCLVLIAVVGLVISSVSDGSVHLNPLLSFENQTFSTSVYLIGLGFFKLVWPFKLCSCYGYGAIESLGWSNPKVLGSFILLLSLTSIAIWSRKRNGIISFSAILILIGLLMNSNLFGLRPEAFNESNLFLATAGFCLMIAGGLSLIIPDDLQNSAKGLFAENRTRLVLIPLVLTLSYFTMTRNFDWLNTYLITRTDIAVCDRSAPLHLLTGKYYLSEAERYPVKDLDNTLRMAESHFRSAAVLYPNWIEPKLQLGNLLLQQNEPELALDIFKQCLQINARSVDALSGLAACHGRLGEIGQAIEEFGAVLLMEPDNLQALNEIVSLYFLNGDIDGAELVNRKFFQIHPNAAEPNIHQGNIALSRGDSVSALEYYREAVRLDDENDQLKEFVGNLSGEELITVQFESE